jgi:hypothetical protein
MPTAPTRMSLPGFMRFAGVALLMLLAGVSAAQGFRNAVVRPSGSQDFQWDAARLLLLGQNPYRATLERLPVPTDRYMPDALAANQFPSALVLLWPYAAMPWGVAKVAWALSNLLFTGMLLYFGLRKFAPEMGLLGCVAIAAALLAGTPWRSLVGNGQHLLFSLAFFAWSVAAARDERHMRAGALLALSLLKYTTIVFLLPYFIYRRWFKPLVAAMVLHFAIHLGVAAYLGESPIALARQSVRVSMALQEQGYLDIAAILDRLGIGSAGAALAIALVLVGVATWLSIRAAAGNDMLVVSVLAFVSTVAVYHRPYDFVVLFFPLMYAAGRRSQAFTLLSLTCIGLSWYVTRILELVSSRTGAALAGDLYLAGLFALWYATIAAGLFTLWRSESPRSPVTDDHFGRR